jgi:hypothetical protein
MSGLENEFQWQVPAAHATVRFSKGRQAATVDSRPSELRLCLMLCNKHRLELGRWAESWCD